MVATRGLLRRKQQLFLGHSCQHPEVDLYRHSTKGIFILN